jgi:hypothetical protein
MRQLDILHNIYKLYNINSLQFIYFDAYNVFTKKIALFLEYIN